MQSIKLINVTSISTAYTTGRIHNTCVPNLMTSHTNKIIQAVTLLNCVKDNQFESHVVNSFPGSGSSYTQMSL
jgi:hypothetical protein